jgi:hypothetical protein
MRAELVESAMAALCTASKYAVATLVQNLKAQSPAVQVRAAVAILEQSTNAVELVALLERLERLEQRLAEQAEQQTPAGLTPWRGRMVRHG